VRGGWSWRVSVCNFGCEPCSGHRRLTCAIGSHWDVRECLIFGRKKDCTILASFLHYARVKLVHVTTPLGGIAHDHNTPCERLCKGNFCLGPCVHDAGRPRGKGSPLQWLMGCSRVFSLRGMNVATRRRAFIILMGGIARPWDAAPLPALGWWRALAFGTSDPPLPWRRPPSAIRASCPRPPCPAKAHGPRPRKIIAKAGRKALQRARKGICRYLPRRFGQGGGFLSRVLSHRRRRA